MTTILFIVVLMALVAFVVLRPLWVREADSLIDFGREAPASDDQERAKMDRNIEAIRDLEFALAEKKVDEKSYQIERSRLTKEAETAVQQLRRKREDARKVPLDQAGTYPKTGFAAAGVLFAATCGVALYLNSQDLVRDVSPHASGKVPIGIQAETKSAKNGAVATAKMPADHPKLDGTASIMGADGVPDPKAMVRRLEQRIATGEPTPQDIAMLARSYRALGRQKEILGLYRDAASRAPKNPDVLFLYASSLFDSGTATARTEADATFDRVLVLRPDMPEALWFKSLILVKKHEIEPAKKILTKLQGLVTSNPEAKKAVAGLLAALNNDLAPASSGKQHSQPTDVPDK